MKSTCVPRSSSPVTFAENHAQHASATYGMPAASRELACWANLSSSVEERKPNVPISSIEASSDKHDAVKRPAARRAAVVAFSLFKATLTCNGEDVTWAKVFATQPKSLPSEWVPMTYIP